MTKIDTNAVRTDKRQPSAMLTITRKETVPLFNDGTQTIGQMVDDIIGSSDSHISKLTLDLDMKEE